MIHRRNSEAGERARQRQEREDSASRLSDEVPSLRTLRLAIRFERGEGTVESEHTRIVVVSRAPALFVVPCSDPHCRDGGHDLTSSIMTHLRARHGTFEGSAACHGGVGAASQPCSRVLKFEASATYG